MGRHGVIGNRVDIAALRVQRVEIILKPRSPAAHQADGPFDPSGDHVHALKRAAGHLDPVRLRHGVGIGRQQDAARSFAERQAHLHCLPSCAPRIRLGQRTCRQAIVKAACRQGCAQQRLTVIAASVQQEADAESVRPDALPGQRIQQARQTVGLIADGDTDRDRPRRDPPHDPAFASRFSDRSASSDI